ncbi:L,D-transpeptidase [Motilibacter aurantiacus]|uniref:L,D-transpeptidase n=1 Tax=Motilibacter aurantiacus TaxID=2714955 RepID=UPI00140DF07D|nr:L,D-transpeptidase [Motilibacter aurantiacus]NHC44008.1 L,D-transpeptidase [Motilibacter aurantiacus]
MFGTRRTPSALLTLTLGLGSVLTQAGSASATPVPVAPELLARDVRAAAVEAGAAPKAAAGTASEGANEATSRAASKDVAPKPRRTGLPARSGSGKRIVYSIARQQVWLVSGQEKVTRTYLVSGRPSQPDPGTFRVYSKSMHTSSSVSDATMNYMVRFTYGERTGAPIGFHDIPKKRSGGYEQRLADLGRPLSAGCVRQAPADAAALWSFAPVGTKVVVTP